MFKDYKEQMTDPRWAARSREIMKRDNFTCQLCGRSDRGLNVHHIKYQNDLDYWDYPDELLMTVCRVCHAKIHGKPVPAEQKPKRIIKRANKSEKSSLHTVFYKALLSNESMTPNDKIVYSFLLYKSYYNDKDEDNDGWIELKKISYRKLAEQLSISPRCVISSLQKLKSLNLITEDEIRAKDVMKDGYFELYKPRKELRNELLIFYSYLKNKAIYFGGMIDTFKYKLAEDYGTTKIGITNLLNRLYKLGLAERLPNGKLKVN